MARPLGVAAGAEQPAVRAYERMTWLKSCVSCRRMYTGLRFPHTSGKAALNHIGPFAAGKSRKRNVALASRQLRLHLRGLAQRRDYLSDWVDGAGWFV